MATWADLLAELNAHADVLEAVGEVSPTLIPNTTDIYRGVIKYAEVSGTTAHINSVAVIVKDFAGGGEAAYWLNKKPSVLTNDPELYITDRTGGGFTAAQIIPKCSEYWENANTGAQDIRNISISNVDGSTILVSGDFDTGAEWEPRSYYLHLVDPDGSVAAGNANVEFQRKKNEAT